MARVAILRKSKQAVLNGDREVYWRLANRVIGGARARAVKAKVPFEIDAHVYDRLLVDQGWRCAYSGIPLEPPLPGSGRPGPFTPSLDRINPKLGYVTGNVRIVCQMVNFALNQWGEEPLRRLMLAMDDRLFQQSRG